LNLAEPGSRIARLCRLGTGAAILVCLALAVLYAVTGRLNADEGWYLYASRLVYEGSLPYRDFAYTQTPLLPYVYGLPQLLIGPSTYLGRATSAALLALNVLLGVRVSRRRGGWAAACVTAWLMAAFSYGIYFTSIVKTYSLLSLLFTSVLAVLSSEVREDARYPAAVLLAAAGAMVRLTAAGFALVVAVYCLARARGAARWLTAGVLAAMSIWLLLFGCRNAAAVEWNLLTYHLGQRGGLPAPAAAIGTALSCLLVVPWFYLSHFVLALGMAAAVALDRGLRAAAAATVRAPGPAAVVGLGLALYIAIHICFAGCLPEYLVPAVLSLFPIAGMVLSRVLGQAGARTGRPTWSGPARALCWIGLAAVLALHPLRHAGGLVDLSGGKLPVEEVRELASRIAANSGEGDQVLALEALAAVYESGRAVLPGLTMAQFSLQGVSREQAERLGLVNPQMLVGYLEQAAAGVVVLTEYDWQMLERMDCREQVQDSLGRRYLLAEQWERFWQRESGVELYVRRSVQ
jgi:hypothetical protein